MQEIRKKPIFNMSMMILMVIIMVIIMIIFVYLVPNEFMMLFFFIFLIPMIILMIIMMKFGPMKKSMKSHPLEYHKKMHNRYKQIEDHEKQEEH